MTPEEGAGSAEIDAADGRSGDADEKKKKENKTVERERERERSGRKRDGR